MIKIIAAKSLNDIIGVNNELPWLIPEDLKHFKALTTRYDTPKDNIIVMGYNTWLSIGERSLPRRLNIVLSRQKRFLPRNALVKQFTNIDDLLKTYKNKTLNIIGGEIVYQYFINIANELHITQVSTYIDEFGKYSKFPKIDPNKWILKEKSKLFTCSDNCIPFRFLKYVLK